MIRVRHALPMPLVSVTYNSAIGGGFGHVGSWLQERGFDLHLIDRDRPIAEGDLDRAARADLLVMLGSTWSLARPMTRSTDDAHASAAIAAERGLVRARLATDQPTLGICFGGQMLCSALGGRVSALPTSFTGWARPRTEVAALGGEWFYLHEDHFTLPADVEPLADAEHASVGFRRGRAWGLQFHPEATGDLLDVWFGHLGVDPLISAPHIEQVRRRADANRAEAYGLLDTIWSQMTAAGPAEPGDQPSAVRSRVA